MIIRYIFNKRKKVGAGGCSDILLTQKYDSDFESCNSYEDDMWLFRLVMRGNRDTCTFTCKDM